jgi:hypothetical protein
MWQDLWVALSLVLVIEGLMPFLSPSRLRDTLQAMAELDDRTLRIIGLVSMVSGVLMLYLVR